MNWKDLAIVSVSSAFLSSIIIFICLDITNGNFDNLADWFGALGSIGAILAVVYQVHKQREEFLEANKVEGTVRCEVEPIIEKVVGGWEVYKGESNLVVYLVNTGHRVEGFKFIGFATQTVLNSLINENIGYDKLNHFGVSSIIDPSYGNFETLQPSESSRKYKFELKVFLNSYEDGESVYPVYATTHGEFYYTKMVIKK